MRRLFRQHLTTIVVATVTAAVTAGGPVIAATVVDFAHNADKVDNRHAVGAGTSSSKRAGKLVATDGSGRLPNNIIAKAPNSDRLGGFTHAQTRAKSLALPIMQNAEGFHLERNPDTPALTMSFVIPSDYVRGAPLKLELIYRQTNACATFLRAYGYITDPVTRTWNRGIWDNNGEFVSGEAVWAHPDATEHQATISFPVTTPATGEAHKLTLTLDQPASPGAAVSLNLRRYGDHESDTCAQSFIIAGMNLRY